MSLKKKTCFYCDAIFTISSSAPGDHFPVPKRLGGTATVPCCRECHSLKDRIGLGDWSWPMIAKVLNDFPKLSRETRIFLAKTMCILQDASAQRKQKGAE